MSEDHGGTADEFENIITQSIKMESHSESNATDNKDSVLPIAPPTDTSVDVALPTESLTSDKDDAEAVSNEAAPSSPEKRVHVKRERTLSGASGSGEYAPASKKPRKELLSRGESCTEDRDVEDGAPSGSKNKRESQEEERMKLQLLVSNFSEEQLNRYEMFRRAAFPKASVKRLMQSVAGTSVSQSVVIAMSGIAKVYVGEIVETALDVLEELGQTGPLQPKHIREAVRRIRQTTGVPTTKYKKVLLH